jgi:hypothetical protein
LEKEQEELKDLFFGIIFASKLKITLLIPPSGG